MLVSLFPFLQASLSQTVSESSSGDTVVQLTVERSPGTFGRVTVSFQVSVVLVCDVSLDILVWVIVN